MRLAGHHFQAHVLELRPDHEFSARVVLTRQEKIIHGGPEAKRIDANKTFPFPPVVRDNLARFVYLLEIPSLIGLIPRDLLNASTNWEFDPLPPPFSENIFSYEVVN